MTRIRVAAFTLVEVLIVVMILVILAMIVVPRMTSATTDAKESAMLTDIQTLQRQYFRYRTDHKGRGPQFGSKGEYDTGNFIQRLTGRTDQSGALSAAGKFGPYVLEWPPNPFVSNSKVAAALIIDTGSPLRDNASGWFFDLRTEKFWPNSKQGALTEFPARPDWDAMP
jgi:prepilin-type N-terminal cleavage/methylation domain-containing protein